MSDVLVFERAKSLFPETLARRGHHIVYRADSSNHCPGCGRSHWYVGRISAECGFCGTAVPLAEARRDHTMASTAPDFIKKISRAAKDQRRFPRVPAKGRVLELLIGGAPSQFALHNISEGGAMGDTPAKLLPESEVCVRLESGIVVPAVVKWAEDGLVGLAFTEPRRLTSLAQSRRSRP